MALSDRDRAILEFERTWWREPGPKELAIRERFDLSTTRYYEIIGDLLDDPEAMAFDPLVVRRLRRLRDRRRPLPRQLRRRRPARHRLRRHLLRRDHHDGRGRGGRDHHHRRGRAQPGR